MVEMTTQGLRKGKAAEARDLLDRAINILPEEDEAVTRAFLYLAKAACLRHAQDKGEEVEQALRAGFTDLEKAVKRSATLKLDAEELLETIFEWFRWQSEFSPSSPKDPMLVESFVIASASKPRPLREKGSVRSGLDTLAVVTAAFEALVANLNAGRYEAALAFLEHVSTEPKKYVLFEHVFPDPEKYVSRVRSTLQAVTRHSDGDKGKRRTNGDEFLAVALDRAQRLQGPSQHIVFSLALLAIERYFSFVRGDDSAQRSQGLRALSLAEKLVEDVWRPNKDDEYVLKSIELYGRYEEGILGQRLLDLSRFYVSEGTSASDQPQARPSAQPSLAEVLDGFLPLKVPPLKVLPPLKTNSQEWARIRTRQERGWERLHSKAFAAAKEALNQPNGLAAALKSSQDLVLLAEQQLLMEVQEESLWDRNGWTFNLHLTRRVYYLLALNLLHRVAQDAPELKDKVAAATVDVAQRVFRSRLAHAAVSLGSSPFLAQEQKTDAIRQELANLDDAVRRMRRDLPGSVVLEKLETERETLLARLEKAEQRVKEISSTTIKATESIVSLQDIQTQLASDEAILAYVMDTGWPPESKRYMDSDYYAVTESQVLVIRRNSAALVMLPRFTRQIDSADLSGNSYSFASLSAEIVRKTMRRMAQAKLGLPLAEDRTEPLAPLLPSAYQLYRQVLEPVRVELEGINHLIVVADGDLGGVPFGMMVMSPPKTEADTQFTKVDWLLNHFETSYIPSLDSFVALRREASSRKVAPKAFVGFGDPVFAERGTQGQPSSLPGAKRELEQIAETLQAGPNALVLGKFATEDAVRTARLEQYRIIAFATHGVLADAETGIEGCDRSIPKPYAASCSC
jgi:CHAT domain-containing protein